MVGMDLEEKLGIGIAPDAAIEKHVRMLRHTTQFPALFGRGVLHEEPRRLGLNGLPEDVAATDVLGGRYADPRADAGLSFHQTIGFQALQGLRDRQLAHAEHGGEFAPRQASADGKHTS